MAVGGWRRRRRRDARKQRCNRVQHSIKYGMYNFSNSKRTKKTFVIQIEPPSSGKTGLQHLDSTYFHSRLCSPSLSVSRKKRARGKVSCTRHQSTIDHDVRKTCVSSPNCLPPPPPSNPPWCVSSLSTCT